MLLVECFQENNFNISDLIFRAKICTKNRANTAKEYIIHVTDWPKPTSDYCLIQS